MLIVKLTATTKYIDDGADNDIYSVQANSSCNPDKWNLHLLLYLNNNNSTGTNPDNNSSWYPACSLIYDYGGIDMMWCYKILLYVLYNYLSY